MRWAVLALASCTYGAGTFDLGAHHPNEQHATIGCLDMTVSRQGQRITYQLGNRCDDPAVVDLAHVPVFADAVQLRPYDPRFELRVARLDARSRAEETIEYRDPDTPRELCVDVAAIAQATPAAWKCWRMDGTP